MTTSGTPFTIQPALTAVALRWRNPVYTLIADTVIPRSTPVGTKAFRYLSYAPGQSLTVPDTQVGRKGSPLRIEVSCDTVTDECLDYGLEDAIPLDDVTQAAASAQQGGPSIDPQARAVEALTDLLLLDREVRVASKVFSSANYASGNVLTLTGNDQFSDYVHSDPMAVILALMDTLPFHPTDITFGRPAWTVFRRHPLVVKAVLGPLADSGVVSETALASLLGVKRVNVGDAWVNTAKRGQAVTKTRVWGKHIAMHFLDPSSTADSGLTWGFTQQYSAAGSVRYASTRFEAIGLRGSTIVRVGETVKEVICAPDCGALIVNAVA